MYRKAEGYFTVEAALVLPMVLTVIILIIYLLIFQYDRCLMEQDMGILALRGTILEADSNQDRILRLRIEADHLYEKKYIAWEGKEAELRLERGMLRVVGSGQISFPFSGEMEDIGNMWTTAVTYENHIISPVSFIRNYHKVKREGNF